jgi:hypothetical protein
MASRRRARLAAETPRKELTSTGGAHGSILWGFHAVILGTAPGAVKRALGRSSRTPPIREGAVLDGAIGCTAGAAPHQHESDRSDAAEKCQWAALPSRIAVSGGFLNISPPKSS